jgi:hypothetical protein
MYIKKYQSWDMHGVGREGDCINAVPVLKEFFVRPVFALFAGL